MGSRIDFVIQLFCDHFLMVPLLLFYQEEEFGTRKRGKGGEIEIVWRRNQEEKWMWRIFEDDLEDSVRKLPG